MITGGREQKKYGNKADARVARSFDGILEYFVKILLVCETHSIVPTVVLRSSSNISTSFVN